MGRKASDPANLPVLSVLIAEQHRTVADSLGHLVTSLGAASIAAQVHTADDALDVAVKVMPDVALVDLELSPSCSLVAGLAELCPDTRVIVLAERAEDAGENLVRALASGAVGAIYKEASPEELARALQSSSRRAPVVADEAAGLLAGSYLAVLTEKRQRDLATIEALAVALEARDQATGDHIRRVTELARRLMEAIDVDLARNEELAYGFVLHDVGKIGVPDGILNKPGPLDEREWGIMRQHPELGIRIVGPIGFSSAATDIILSHHERFDGTGYPLGLKGNEIPLAARLFSIVDAYDAMTNDRPYRPAMTTEDALQIIRGKAGPVYDPEIVDTFIDLKEVDATEH